jgi:Tfp pilus assembly protein PilN
MIEINLLPGQKKRKAPGAGFRLSLPDFRGLLATIKDPYLIAAVAAWGLALGGGGALFVLDQTTLAALDHRLDNVKTEKRRFDILIAQKRQMELSRDSLLAEIIVIRRIDEDRYVWPHVLDQITKALPPYTWLTGIATISAAPAGLGPAPPAAGAAPAPADSLGVGTVRISIDGRTVDIEAFTTFLRQLTASPWLAEVAPTNTTTMIEADRPVTAFNVVARYRPADPRYVHTVPLTQSVR